MINELFDKIQRDFDAAIQEHFEQKAKLSVPVRRGPAASLQQSAERMAEAAFRRLKHNRAYALDEDGKLEFAALAVAARNNGKNLVHVLEELSKVVVTIKDGATGKVTQHSLGLLQKRPSDDEGICPKLPIDPVTGERIRNPWLEPHDFKSQNVIRETSPRLALWLEDAAKNNGVTAHMLDALESERIEAEHLRTLKYGDQEWTQNKLRTDSGATLTEQNLFAKSISDPWLLQFHRQEAKAGSPRLKFANLTTNSGIRDRSPEIREIHKAAGEIFESWKAEAEQKAVAA